jgi:hypothetical protein
LTSEKNNEKAPLPCHLEALGDGSMVKTKEWSRIQFDTMRSTNSLNTCAFTRFLVGRPFFTGKKKVKTG